MIASGFVRNGRRDRTVDIHGMHSDFSAQVVYKLLEKCFIKLFAMASLQKNFEGGSKCTCSCGFRCDFRKELVTHVSRTHSMDRVEWICDDCSASLASSRALRDHYRHVHKFLVQDEGARTRVHRTPQLNEMAHEGGEDVVMSDEIEAEDTGDLQVAAVCNGANNENVNVRKRLRSAILQMSSTIIGRLKLVKCPIREI